MTQDELVGYLDSDDNEFGLDAMATHGFLCAVVVGKPLDDWLDVYFDGNANKVADDIKTALTTYKDSLLDSLRQEEPIEFPFFSDSDTTSQLDVSEESDVVAWCIGFVDAMYANEDTNWFDDADTEEEVADLTLPMIVLSGIADEDDELASMREDGDVVADLVNAIESNLTELYLLFHTQD